MRGSREEGLQQIATLQDGAAWWLESGAGKGLASRFEVAAGRMSDRGEVLVLKCLRGMVAHDVTFAADDRAARMLKEAEDLVDHDDQQKSTE